MTAEHLHADAVDAPQAPPHIANRLRPDEEIGAGILGPEDDDLPWPTEEERQKKNEGLGAVIDEFEAECGPIPEWAHEWARANLSFERG